MKPWGISSSWKSLSPLDLKGKRRRVTQEAGELEPDREMVRSTAVQWAKRRGWRGIDYPPLSLLPLLPPTGLSHHWFLLAKPNRESEDRDTWMMHFLEVSLVRGKWRWASMCTERLNHLTKCLLLKFKPWSSRIPSITSIIYIIRNSSWKLKDWLGN